MPGVGSGQVSWMAKGKIATLGATRVHILAMRLAMLVLRLLPEFALNRLDI